LWGFVHDAVAGLISRLCSAGLDSVARFICLRGVVPISAPPRRLGSEPANTHQNLSCALYVLTLFLNCFTVRFAPEVTTYSGRTVKVCRITP